MKRLWNCKEVVLVPIVVGALGTFSKRFHLYLKKAGLDGSLFCHYKKLVYWEQQEL